MLTRPCIREFVHIQSGCQARINNSLVASFITQKRTCRYTGRACMADARLGSRSGHRDPDPTPYSLFCIGKKTLTRYGLMSSLRLGGHRTVLKFCPLPLVRAKWSTEILMLQLASYFRKGSSTHVFWMTSIGTVDMFLCKLQKKKYFLVPLPLDFPFWHKICMFISSCLAQCETIIIPATY